MIGYTDAGYLSSPHPKLDLYSYMEVQLFMKSSKQTLTATSTNHSKIIALYEASRECVWLRRMINHI